MKLVNILLLENDFKSSYKIASKINEYFNCQITAVFDCQSAMKNINKYWYNILIVNTDIKNLAEMLNEISDMIKSQKIERISIVGLVDNSIINNDNTSSFSIKSIFVRSQPEKQLEYNKFDAIYELPLSEDIKKDKFLTNICDSASSALATQEIEFNHLNFKALTELGLSTGATFEDIKSRYRILAKKYHPDVAIGKQEDVYNKFASISSAYEYLSAANNL